MKVILIMALTIDGKIARDADHFPDWTGREDKLMFKETTQKAGVVVMGSKTYDAIGKPLPNRKNIVLTRKKTRWSVQGNLVFTGRTPAELLADLEKEGFQTVVLAGGSKINTLFIREGLIDEMYITFSPKIFGTGLSLFTEQLSLDLKLIDFKKLGSDEIFTRYRVIK